MSRSPFKHGIQLPPIDIEYQIAKIHVEVQNFKLATGTLYDNLIKFSVSSNGYDNLNDVDTDTTDIPFLNLKNENIPSQKVNRVSNWGTIINQNDNTNYNRLRFDLCPILIVNKTFQYKKSNGEMSREILTKEKFVNLMFKFVPAIADKIVTIVVKNINDDKQVWADIGRINMIASEIMLRIFYLQMNAAVYADYKSTSPMMFLILVAKIKTDHEQRPSKVGPEITIKYASYKRSGGASKKNKESTPKTTKVVKTTKVAKPTKASKTTKA